MEDSRAAKLALGRQKLANHQRRKKNVEIAPNQVDRLNLDNTDSQKHIGQTSDLSTNGDLDIRYQESPPTLHSHQISHHTSSDFNTISTLNSESPALEQYVNQEHDKFNLNINNSLNNDIASYQKSIEILINDKSDMNNKLKTLEHDIVETKEQNHELIYKINLLNNHNKEIEEELSAAKLNSSKYQVKVDSLLEDRTEIMSNEKVLKQRCRDFEEKLDESTTMLKSLFGENETLKAELQRVKSEYELSQLHIQQVSQVHDNVELGEQLQLTINEKHTYMKLFEETQKKLKESESDKNQINQQYQQYVQQLNSQLESLTDKHQTLLVDFENLRDQEQSLLRQMGNLEKQLQGGTSLSVKNDNVLNDEIVKDLRNENESIKLTNKEFMEKINGYDIKSKNLEELLSEKVLKIEELNETLHSLQTEKLDVHKLIAANESDRVAAQLATTQNLKLKDESIQLQDAYNQMSNSKLELTQLLETERNLNKDLVRKLGEDEYNVKDLQIKLKAKNDEMMRLQTNCRNFETELLQLTQVNDNLRHYEAVSQNINLLQSELDSARQKVAILMEENKKLKQVSINTDSNVILSNNNVNVDANFNNEEHIIPCNNNIVIDSNFLPTDEAMKKLQDRFAVTVKELADLSDEKQKLEHIVLQLQSETETICEYIALYHKQRAILRQREIEKNAQLALVVQEKSKLKTQLDELKLLINECLSISRPVLQNVTSEQSADVTQKILSLLSDIAKCQLIEGNELHKDKIAPCPCCSGKMIDV